MADPWKIEDERQAKELAEIISTCIKEYGRRLMADGKQPILNAVASALVTEMGAVLASVQDRRARKALRHEMERCLPIAIARHEGRTGSAEIITKNRRADA